MWKIIFGLVIGVFGIAHLCFAGDVSFGEAKTAVSGADAQEFEVKDVDGDSKPDLIRRDSFGDLKYSLQVSQTSLNTKVIHLDGDDDYMALPENITPTENVTIEARIKSDNYNNTNAVFSGVLKLAVTHLFNLCTLVRKN